MVPVLIAVVALLSAVIAALVYRLAHLARAAAELRASEERFRHMTDRAPVMMWTTHPDNSTLDYVNRTCAEFTGLPSAKLIDEGWLTAVHPADRGSCTAIYAPAVEARLPFRMEYRLRRADGTYRWVLDIAVPKQSDDGAYAGYVGCTIDITDRKESEEAIRESEAILQASNSRIQDLAGRLIKSQEVERSRIARELHDDLSQQLAGLAIALSALKRVVNARPDSADLSGEVASLQERAMALADNIRRLSHDLHPTVLTHAGLVAALSAYCTELQRQRPIKIAFNTEGQFSDADADVALCLYRVAQEALRNVVTHANAHHAEVRLLGTGDRIELTITDDGRGFDVADTRERNRGLGLVSMNERVRLAGGTVSVRTEMQRGTTVHVLLSRSVSSALEPQLT